MVVVVVVVVEVEGGAGVPHSQEMVVVRALATRNCPPLTCRLLRLCSRISCLKVRTAPVLTCCSGGTHGPASLVGPATDSATQPLA